MYNGIRLEDPFYIDRVHGPVVETLLNGLEWIFVHTDGYKEICYLDDMEEEQETV